MSRRPFGWDLPPGVTDRQIDDTVQGDEPPTEAEKLLAEAVRQLAEAKVELMRLKAVEARVATLLGAEVIIDAAADDAEQDIDWNAPGRHGPPAPPAEITICRGMDDPETGWHETYIRYSIHRRTRIELARRNTQVAALLDVAEAAKELLGTLDDLLAPLDWSTGLPLLPRIVAVNRLRAALAATADAPKAEP